METRQLKISKEVDQMLQTTARQFSMSKKSFAEQSILFFSRNTISPKTYSPGREFDQVQLIKKSTERIIELLRQHEQAVLAELMPEVLRNQVAIQALINLVVDYAIKPDQQEAVAGRIQDYINEHLARLSQLPSREEKV